MKAHAVYREAGQGLEFTKRYWRIARQRIRHPFRKAGRVSRKTGRLHRKDYK